MAVLNFASIEICVKKMYVGFLKYLFIKDQKHLHKRYSILYP